MAYFRDISTFGGCAACSTAAVENIKIIEEEKLLDNVKAMGDYLLDGLKALSDHPNIGDVRGKGLLCGVEFVEDKKSKKPLDEGKAVQVCGATAAEGVLIGRTNRCLPGMNTIVNFAPAYVVTKADIDRILAAFKAGVTKVLG